MWFEAGGVRGQRSEDGGQTAEEAGLVATEYFMLPDAEDSPALGAEEAVYAAACLAEA
jgi:hypothetical protein